MLLRATGKKVGGHEFVDADPDDPFWAGAGYVPAEDESGEWVGVEGGVELAKGEDAEAGAAEATEEGEEEEADADAEGEDPDIEVDLDAMTVKELEQFVVAAELDVDLSAYPLKAAKVAAIEKALEAQNGEG